MSALVTAALCAAGVLTSVIVRKYLRAWEWVLCLLGVMVGAANAVFDCLAIDTKGAVFYSVVALVFAWGLRESWPRRYRRHRDA